MEAQPSFLGGTRPPWRPADSLASAAQLYSGSADGSVRVWDLANGQCASVVDVGGEVDSLLLEGGFLFVGLNVQAAGTRQGLVKARAPAANALTGGTYVHFPERYNALRLEALG